MLVTFFSLCVPGDLNSVFPVLHVFIVLSFHPSLYSPPTIILPIMFLFHRCLLFSHLWSCVFVRLLAYISMPVFSGFLCWWTLWLHPHYLRIFSLKSQHPSSSQTPEQQQSQPPPPQQQQTHPGGLALEPQQMQQPPLTTRASDTKPGPGLPKKTPSYIPGFNKFKCSFNFYFKHKNDTFGPNNEHSDMYKTFLLVSAGTL